MGYDQQQRAGSVGYDQEDKEADSWTIRNIKGGGWWATFRGIEMLIGKDHEDREADWWAVIS